MSESNISFSSQEQNTDRAKDLGFDINEMMEAGMHFGHKTSKLHPRMKDFVVGVRNTVHLIDLEETARQLKTALDFLQNIIEKGAVVLICSTKPPLAELVKSIAQECALPYVVNRWVGGTFTNFAEIRKRIHRFQQLSEEKKSGAWEKYTKKEQLKKEALLEDLKEKFEGLQGLEKLPDVVFVCDAVKDSLCLKEARSKGIKTIAIIDTNADPLCADYPIFANDDAMSSVKYILDKVKEVILKAKGAKQ